MAFNKRLLTNTIRRLQESTAVDHEVEYHKLHAAATVHHDAAFHEKDPVKRAEHHRLSDAHQKEAEVHYAKLAPAHQHRIMSGEVSHMAKRVVHALLGRHEAFPGVPAEILEKAKLGSGKRFAALKGELSHEKGVSDPAAVAAAIGRKKYGAKKMGAMSHHESVEPVAEALGHEKSWSDPAVHKPGARVTRSDPHHNPAMKPYERGTVMRVQHADKAEDVKYHVKQDAGGSQWWNHSNTLKEEAPAPVADMAEGVKDAEAHIGARVQAFPAGHKAALTDLWHGATRGTHFKHIMRAAENLHKKGVIHFDGVHVSKPAAKESAPAVIEDEGVNADYAAAGRQHGPSHVLDALHSHTSGAASRHIVAASNAYHAVLGHGSGVINHGARQAVHAMVAKHGLHKVLGAAVHHWSDNKHPAAGKVYNHLKAAHEANEAVESPAKQDPAVKAASGVGVPAAEPGRPAVVVDPKQKAKADADRSNVVSTKDTSANGVQNPAADAPPPVGMNKALEGFLGAVMGAAGLGEPVVEDEDAGVEPDSVVEAEAAGEADHNHPMYHTPVKVKGMRAKQTAASNHTGNAGSILRKVAPHLSKADHLHLAKGHAAKAKEHDKSWGETQHAAHMHTFKTKPAFHDYKVSGVGRDEYSDEHKEKLRHHAHAASLHRALSHAHLSAGRHAPSALGEDVYADGHPVTWPAPAEELSFADRVLAASDVAEARIDPNNMHHLAGQYQVHKNHYHFNKDRGNAAEAEHHRKKANEFAAKYHHQFANGRASVVTPVMNHHSIKQIGEGAAMPVPLDAKTIAFKPVGGPATNTGGKTTSVVRLVSEMGAASSKLSTLLATYGGKPAAGGGWEFPIEQAQQFLNQYNNNGGKGYIVTPSGNAGPNETVEDAVAEADLKGALDESGRLKAHIVKNIEANVHSLKKHGVPHASAVDAVAGSYERTAAKTPPGHPAHDPVMVAMAKHVRGMKEGAPVDESSYHALVAARDHAEAAHKATTRNMHAYPRLANGLIPDHVKSTPEYKKHRAEHDAAFAHLRHINGQLVKHPEHRQNRKGGPNEDAPAGDVAEEEGLVHIRLPNGHYVGGAHHGATGYGTTPAKGMSITLHKDHPDVKRYQDRHPGSTLEPYKAGKL